MEKFILPAIVTENEEIAEGIMRMRITCESGAGMSSGVIVRPGQFINVYLNRKDLLLPRPISICRADGADLTLVFAVVGAGTRELARYAKGTELRVSAPLGNDYLQKLESVKGVYHYEGWEAKAARIGKKVVGIAEESALVIGGGLGVPPLLELTAGLLKKGLLVTAALGFRDETFLTKEFEALGAKVLIATETGREGFRGNVVGMLRENDVAADRYFACGPKPMLKAIFSLCAEREKDVLVSLEERMGCGFGACLACACKIKGETGTVQKRVCKDGPIFWGSEVEWDA